MEAIKGRWQRMSDLISRSELLKRFLVNKDGHRIPERDCDNLEVTVSIKDVKTIIKEQPTAYDIDKVVEQLEEIRAKKTCNKEKCDTKELCRICVVDDAIEIVKQGVVTDDVCEWKAIGANDNWSTSCDKNSTHNVFGVAWFKRCPYCGRKLKIVGE